MSGNKYQNLSQALRDLPKPKLVEVLSQLSEDEANEILYESWRDIWARPDQIYGHTRPEQITMWCCGRGLIPSSR